MMTGFATNRAAQQQQPCRSWLRHIKKITANLRLFHFEASIDRVSDALDYLTERKFFHQRDALIKKLMDPNPTIVAGATRELGLMVKLNNKYEALDGYVMKKYSILDVNAQINGIEFFDIIAQDSTREKLLLIESKNDHNYSLGDFSHQFFGIGNQIGTSKKPISQIDVLANQGQFPMLAKYSFHKDIVNGNYEVWVVTSQENFKEEFEKLYKKPFVPFTLFSLLDYMGKPDTPLIPPKATPLSFTVKDLKAAINEKKKSIPSSLEGIVIRFEDYSRIS